MMGKQFVKSIVLFIKLRTGVIRKKGGSWEAKGCKSTGGVRTWYGKLEAVGQELYSKFNEIIQKKKKNERGRKQEKIQQVVNFASIDYISAFTRYKKITFFISGKEFHLARLSSQAEQRTRIISSTCSARYELISIY